MNFAKEMQVVILAGGLGTRLMPITEKIPKPMFRICGKPFLEYKLSQIKDRGIKEVLLCVSYLGEKIENYFGNGEKLELNLKYSYEKERLGTAGALKNAEFLIKKDNFIVMNGDTYSDINLNEFFLCHKNSLITMAVSPCINPEENELVEIKNGFVGNFHKRGTKEHKEYSKKNPAPMMNVGLYVLNREILSFIPKGKVCSLEQEIFPKFSGEIRVFEYNGYIKDLANIHYCAEFEEYIRGKNDNKK
jgi:mannose-1-phosphate guanylyltransferase